MHVLPTKRASTGVNVQQSSHRYAHVVTQQQRKDPRSRPYSNTWPRITHIIESDRQTSRFSGGFALDGVHHV